MLRLAWCRKDAARYAVQRWHYSGKMPVGKLACVGAWEDGRYIGAVVFGRGASPQIGVAFGMKQDEVCELVRVALTGHKAPTSRIVGIAVRIFRKRFPTIRLMLSFADQAQNHHGGIYQAMGWTYLGPSASTPNCVVNGRTYHYRSALSKFGGWDLPTLQKADPQARHIRLPPKHRYALALHGTLAAWLAERARPYPKREA